MKKYPSFFPRFIEILTEAYHSLFIATGIENNSKTTNTVNDNLKLVKDTPLLVFISLVITSLIFVLLGHIKLLPYVFLVLILLSSGMYWLEYNKHNFSSYKKHKKLEITKTPKKSGAATFAKINTYIITEKKYLSTDISLNSIATFFNISKGYISQIINIHAEKSFNDYINELRIEASQKMLLDKHYDNYTIESIGLECGFTSKSNFYTTFKKISGQTPNQYKKVKKISSGYVDS